MKKSEEVSLTIEIKHDISHGIPLTETARRLDIEWAVLHRICGRNEIEYIRSPTKKTGTTDAYIVSLKEEGMSASDIARKIGTSRQNIHARLKKVLNKSSLQAWSLSV